MKRFFIDSNIIIYANDRSAEDKQSKAIEIITTCMKSQNAVLSIQVLQEYANVALKDLQQDSAVVLRQLKLLEAFPIIAPTAKMVRRSVELRQSYRISFWDASIIAAAEKGDCDCLLSEDLNAGQYYSGIQILNPFSKNFNISDI